MLQEKDLTLDKVQDIARALEAANAQSKSIESRPNMNIGENCHVNKVVANRYCHKGKNAQKNRTDLQTNVNLHRLIQMRGNLGLGLDQMVSLVLDSVSGVVLMDIILMTRINVLQVVRNVTHVNA